MDGFAVAVELRKRIVEKTPSSLVRLGDGEAALLLAQDVSLHELSRCLKVWFGHRKVSFCEVEKMSMLLKGSLHSADIIGIPRVEQGELNICYQMLLDNLEQFIPTAKSLILTDAAIHRYLQYGLLFRYLLRDIPFLGLITSRDIRHRLSNTFGIKNIELHQIRGEATHPGRITLPHYPEGYERIMGNLSVPFKGAVYLVGAGWCGKIYCDLIKQQGGIAIDIGSIFDSWSNTPSRLLHPSHSLGTYKVNTQISKEKALKRYVKLLKFFNNKSPLPTAKTLSELPELW